jgi:hypothetical protein
MASSTQARAFSLRSDAAAHSRRGCIDRRPCLVPSDFSVRDGAPFERSEDFESPPVCGARHDPQRWDDNFGAECRRLDARDEKAAC